MEETLDNILKRWQRYGQYEHNEKWLKEEKEEVKKVLQGKTKIERVLRCGHCKNTVIAKGLVNESEEYKATVHREFSCPECGNIIREDYVYKPRISALLR